MSNNLGCGCNCNGNHGGANGQGASQLMIQQGDTFSLVFQYKEDNTAMALPEGYDLIVGIYDPMSRPLKTGSVLQGSIVPIQDNKYSLPITHDECMKMIGQVTIELTIADAQRNVVDHASEIVTMSLEPRRNNTLL